MLDFLRVGISADSDQDLFTYCQNFFGFEFKFAAMVSSSRAAGEW